MAKPRLHAAARGQRIDQRQLGLGLAIEHVDAALQRVVHLAGGLAHAGEHDFGRIAAGLDHAIEFAARHDIEPRAGLGQQRQNGRATNWLLPRSRRCAAGRQGFIVGAIILQDRALEYTYAGVPACRAMSASGTFSQ